MVLVLCEMQSASSRIWTRVAVSISYDDNHYTMGTILFYRPHILTVSAEKEICNWHIGFLHLTGFHLQQTSFAWCFILWLKYFSLTHFTLYPYFIMLSVKQGGIKYHFLSLWYDSTWDWSQVSRAICEHSNHHDNIQICTGGRHM